MSDFSEDFNNNNEVFKKSSSIVRIIDKLAGEQGNLKVCFQELRFHLNKQSYTINGEVNFNVVYSSDVKNQTMPR